MSDAIKKFIKENLIIDTELESEYSSGNNIIVGLRFAGDTHSFTNATVYIPDDT